jgi:hypothetical protein
VAVQHRIFVVPPASRVTWEDARLHWEQRHGEAFTGTPGLRRYRQNRPVEQEWQRGAARFCSETWFDDRETERAAYGSPHYRDVVTPDEATFLDRDAAWSAVVLDDQPLEPGEGLRVLWFDTSPPSGQAWRSARLNRPVPAPGTGSTVHVADVVDVDAALALTRHSSGVALVCRAVHQDPAVSASEEGR